MTLVHKAGRRMKIGIVGGGLTGLALAQRLSARGHAVSVFERGRQIGGLATYHDFGSFFWDRFYHVILPSDSYLMRFMRDIGLGDKLRWQTTRTGFYVDEQFYSLDSSLDFLKFPPLSLWDKFRLALTILYCSRIDDWRRLEKRSVEEFLLKTSGRSTYEKLWKPLLLAKLGENYRRVSAVFIWSYVKRMFSARDSSAQKEQLGHVSGGYKAVFDRVEQVITDAGGVIKTDTTVERVGPLAGGGMTVVRDGQSEAFDKVIFTGPVNVLKKVVSPELVHFERPGGEVEYLGVICAVLVSRKPLMPYYILNIADDRVPFTGVIGMSNVVSTDETAGRHITYLPKYLLSTDPMLQLSDEELREQFVDGLRLMFPDLDLEDIESVHINRAVKVQPLQVIDYSQIVPQCATRHPDFFILNTAQFLNNTLNNNQVIKSVDEFLQQFGAVFEEESRVSTDCEFAEAATA